MKSNIYFVIPPKEEKFKEYFTNGQTWHNNLWHTTSKYIEILKHWQSLIKNQRETFNQEKKNWEEPQKTLLEDLQNNFKKETDNIKKSWQQWLLNDFTSKNYQTYSEKFAPFANWEQHLEAWRQWDKINEQHKIWLIEKTRDKITFNYRIPDNIITNLDNYLFNYLGIWYEVKEGDYKLIGYTEAEIKATYSKYWNDYWYCLKANANGVIHNSPYLQTEICACPSFLAEEQIVRNVFVITNYELKWNLLKAWGGRDKGNWYLLWLNAKSGGYQSGNPDFPWIKLGSWEKINWGSSALEEIKSEIADGKSEQLFSLVSQRLEDANGTANTPFNKIEAWTDVTVSSKKISKGTNSQEIKEWLNENYPAELNHCRTNHILSTLYWRDKIIWQGNYHEIRDLKLVETANSSGTVVSFHMGGRTIASVHESIFIKIGKENSDNVILNTVISTAAGAAIGAATAGVGAVFATKSTAALVQSATIAGAAKGAVAGGVGSAVGGIKNKLLNYGESVRQEYTIEEFQHKFFRSGHYPLSLVLEQDEELINRYHANRILKGLEGNQYFNTATFGNYLNEKGFHKFHFLTLNMYGNNQQWFKERLETGVRIDDGTLSIKEQDWYRLGLPRKRIKSTGASSSGSLDTIEIIDKKETLGQADFGDNKYSNEDYIGSSDNALWSQMKSQLKGKHHEGSNPIPNFCLGCLTGGGHKGNTSYNWKSEINLTVGGTFSLKTNGSGVQTFTVPAEGGTLIIECQGTGSAEIYMMTTRTVNRHISGEPPAGFNLPPAVIETSGVLSLPSSELNPNEPDINEPEVGEVDPRGGEPEMPPVEPDLPEIDPTPDVDPTPEPDPNDPDTTPDTGDRDPNDYDPFGDYDPRDFD